MDSHPTPTRSLQSGIPAGLDLLGHREDVLPRHDFGGYALDQHESVNAGPYRPWIFVNPVVVVQQRRLEALEPRDNADETSDDD